ncbi:MAG: prepilin peptidase, partial [Selenomonadaceae bacterium]|nr:prepilin peptidase [Selenomonadaceae bacterium]
MIIIYIMMSIALTLAGSFWIDRLYKLSTDSLTFPNEIQSRSRFRKPLLLIFVSFCIINLINIPTPQMMYSIIAAYLLVLIMVTDFEQYVIFNKMLVPFALIGAVYIFHLNLPILNHLAAALLGGVIFLILALITKGGIGGGDIKLVAVLGLWFGIDDLLFIVVAASIMAGVAALIMIIFTKKSRRDYLAYGPYFS